MISPLDDLPIHGPAVDSFETFVFDTDASVITAHRLTIHPELHIADAAFSVVHAGRQRSLHASGRLGPVDSRLTVGPISIDVDKRMAQLSAGASAPELGIDSSLTAHARSVPAAYSSRDTTTIVQWCAATMTTRLDGQRLDPLPVHCIRRHSWGIEPASATVHGAPAHELPQFFRYEIVLELDGTTLTAAADEEADGWRRFEHATAGTLPAHHRFEPEYRAGSRWCARGRLELTDRDHTTRRVELETVGLLPLRGIGLHDPNWAPGAWHDELAVGTQSWRLDDLEPSDVHHLRAIHVVHARADDGRKGIGLIDLVAVGPHEPSGLRGFTAGA